MARFALLLVSLLCLLSLATSASAECGWVLWANETRREEPTRNHTWETVAASSSEPGCDEKLRAEIDRQKRNLATAKPFENEQFYSKVIDGHILAIYFFRKNASGDALPLRTQTINYVCLPDSIDPRGPKAK